MTTEGERESRQPSEQACLVIGALADGARVEPAALRAALDDSSVRDYLVDLMSLRNALGTMGELPAVRWHERRSFRSRMGWLTAAAAIVIGVTAG